jgi:hypothetical protein
MSLGITSYIADGYPNVRISCRRLNHSTISAFHAYPNSEFFIIHKCRGLNHWFSGILYQFIDATNNRTERALRKFVVLIKIIATLRKTKGIGIVETIMTIIATWKQRGQDTFSMIRTSIKAFHVR